MNSTQIFVLSCALLLGHFNSVIPLSADEHVKLIDDYFDARFSADQNATEQLLKKINPEGSAGLKKLEELLGKKRSNYPATTELLGKTSRHAVECLHVDYKTVFLMFVPKDLDTKKPAPLVIVGHGGNSSMSPQRAESTAKTYLRLYAPSMGKHLGAVVVAPVSSRGWGHIGNSLILSTISQVKRMLPIDPNQVFITGQSMGGHMSYRAAITLADRFAAVSPHSGGYNYVEKKAMANFINVPGYAIWGRREPFGINRDNRINQKWAEQHSLNWQYVEKNGGHTIYVDELPNVAEFFKDHPRDLFRQSVYIRQGGPMKFTKTWQVKSWPKHNVYSDEKPLRWNMRHWLEITPREDIKEPLTIFASNKGNNRFEITSQNVRACSIYLHPNMVDLDKPIVVVANGKTIFDARVQTDPRIMLELAREFDDRGRTYWARVELKIDSDREVPMEIVGK